MTVENFKGVNVTLRGDGGLTSDLPVYSDGRLCVSKWRLSEEELQQLIRNNGELYLTVYHPPHHFPPVSITVDNPLPPHITEYKNIK